MTFIDVMGVHLVLDAHASANGNGWELAIVGAHGEVRRTLEVAGVSGRLPHDDAPRS